MLCCGPFVFLVAFVCIAVFAAVLFCVCFVVIALSVVLLLFVDELLIAVVADVVFDARSAAFCLYCCCCDTSCCDVAICGALMLFVPVCACGIVRRCFCLVWLCALVMSSLLSMFVMFVCVLSVMIAM